MNGCFEVHEKDEECAEPSPKRPQNKNPQCQNIVSSEESSIDQSINNSTYNENDTINSPAINAKHQLTLLIQKLEEDVMRYNNIVKLNNMGIENFLIIRKIGHTKKEAAARILSQSLNLTTRSPSQISTTM